LLQPATVYSVVQPMHIEKLTTISLFKLAAIGVFAWCVYFGAVLVVLAMKSLGRPIP